MADMNALCLLACALLAPSLQDRRQPIGDEFARLRSQGPPALERLLGRYDALPPGAERDALEREIDAVAAQRYATVSRLFWYTDLEAAKAAASASARPILSLRMLGRLDEDLSCANSRLFRVVLYANAEVSRFLRESFVLHWSSERPAPRITIDFGDGRRIETTIAGNSAHYVLDQEGRPLDVLPGLYSPVAFRRELEAVLPFARESPFLPDADRLARAREHHRERARSRESLWSVKGERVAVFSQSGMLAAENLTISKAAMEMPSVFGAGLGGARPGLASGWAFPAATLFVRRRDEARLDDASRALVRRLAPTDWAREPRPLDDEAILAGIASLESLVAADTEANETTLREQIHFWFDSQAPLPDFAALNERVYRELFLTPATDPWLGMSTPGVFTGLPRDGIVK